MKLEIVPIFQDEAFAFISQNHRHHKKPVGSVFQVALSDGEKIVGVAIVGRPNGRMQQGWLYFGSNEALYRWNAKRLLNALFGLLAGFKKYGIS